MKTSTTICTRSTLRTILRKFFKTIFRKTRRKMRRRWRTSVPGMKRTLSTRSMRFSTAYRLNVDQVLDEAKGRKAKELAQEYARREPGAVTLVHELLAGAGLSMDRFMARCTLQKLDDIERIDRLITTAESRRNASLHEIERRRAVLGETLRRSVQEIEDGEFEVIEPTPAEGKNAA